MRTDPGNEDDPMDAELSYVLAEYIDRLNAGEMLDEERIRREQPKWAEEVLQQLAVYEGAGVREEAPLGTLGDYTLRRQIGRGGMGVVYEAWQGSMDRVVALKVLPPGVAADDRAYGRFMQEARAAGKLSHPNVVAVHASGQDENTPYYAMEYVEGETLAQLLGKEKNAPAEDKTAFGFPRDDVAYYSTIARCFADVADGLQHAHSNGVVHRDIKPSNLILDQEGRLRILDFGLARLEGQDSLTMSGDFLGTLAYMSPEQAKRRKIPVDHRTDIYSLGATLYELLTHEQPFRGSDHNDTLSQIIERDPRPPRQLNGRIPPDLETIVLKCLRKDAGDRYGTAEALGQDLRRFVRGDAIEARPIGQLEQLRRQLWRRRARVGVALAVSFLLVAGIILARRELADYRREREGMYDAMVLEAVEHLHVRPALEPGRGKTAPDPRNAAFLINGESLASHFQSPSLEEAIEGLRTAWDLLPERVDAPYYLARGLWTIGSADEARATLDALLRVAPSFSPGRALRAAVLDQVPVDTADSELASPSAVGADTWLVAQRAAKNGDWEHAEAAYTRLLLAEEKAPSYLGSVLDLHLARGIARWELDDVLGAVGDFTVAQSLMPNAIAPTLFLGQLYYRFQEPERARQEFESLYQRTALRDQVAFEVARFYQRLWKSEAALDWFERMSPGFLRERGKTAALGNLGWLMGSRHEKFDRAAVGSARRAVEFAPGDPTAPLALAAALARSGEFAEARDIVEALPPLPDETPWQSAVALSEVYMTLRDLERAREVLRHALRTHPRVPQLHSLLGGSYHMAGRLDEAIAEYKIAARLDPDPHGSEFNLGIALQNQGKLAEAIEWASKGVARNPNDRAAQRWLASYLEKSGDWEGALLHAVQSIRVQPAIARSWFLTGLLKRMQPTEPLSVLDPILSTAEHLVREGGEPNADLLHACALACLYGAAARDAKKALEFVDRAIELEPHRNYTVTRAQALLALGDAPAAVLALGSVSHRSVSNRFLRKLFERCCQESFPALPSAAAVDCLLRLSASSELDDRELLVVVRRTYAEGKVPRAVLAYLEGCVLERAGDLPGALQHYKVAAEAAPADAIVQSRLAKVTAASGDAGHAEESLRRLLMRSPWRESRELWRAWLELNWFDLKRPSAETLRRFPVSEEDTRPEEHKAQRHARDCRWLLEELAAGSVLRINCGAEKDYEDSSSRTWSRDRFYTGGGRYSYFPQTAKGGFLGPISGSDDPPLYQSVRIGRRERHMIPLPTGRYRIEFHFAEIMFRGIGTRVFDVFLEGERYLDDYDVFASAGFATPEVHEVTRTIEDGALELEGVSEVAAPFISAIVIERLK